MKTAVFVGLCHPDIGYGQTGEVILGHARGKTTYTFEPHDKDGSQTYQVPADCLYALTS